MINRNEFLRLGHPTFPGVCSESKDSDIDPDVDIMTQVLHKQLGLCQNHNGRIYLDEALQPTQRQS